MSLLNTYYSDVPYQGAVGYYPTNISNPALQWEKTNKLNIGLDFGFFDDALLLSGNYFRNRSSNQLIYYRIPIQAGFDYVLRNFPATVQNNGIELMLNATPVKSRKFSWQTSVNITIPRNKLIAFDNLVGSPYEEAFTIGKPVNQIKVFNYVGVNSTTGLYEFLTSKGEKTSDPSYASDRNNVIDPNPKFYGGFSNTLQYREFTLDLLFQFVDIIAQNYHFGNQPGDILNQPVSVLSRWQEAGDHTDIQKVSVGSTTSTSYSAALNSDASYGGSSYMRLKNISLSYSFPPVLLKKVRLNNVRAFVQGQNLLTFTNYIGNDPESRNVAKTPPLKMFTFGIQASL
ncbi:MAG: hypothetical protein EOO88_31100 [Pedobacter sp.]|nr:MAG: hypothetical protein EOO88_31100 [Pedobacter sp.]